MRLVLTAAIVLIIAILLGSSAYVIFFTGEENNDEIKDTEAPTIDSITGGTTGTTGKITTISVTFSDNIEIIVAMMYYKTESTDSWSNTSILSGSADIVIPSDSDEDWYYYVVVDDEAGNGPVGDPSTDGSSHYTITVSKNVEDLVHYVFIEEGTATWCVQCPAVARILHELYESGEYNFYYVSMVHDKNEKARDRLEDNEHNILGFPTVYIDGGYELVYGEKDKSVFEEKISKAENRDVPEIAVNVTSEIDEAGKRVETTVVIDNYESDTYTGRLKVYLTNRIAWADYDGDAYHFGFLDYIADEDVSINGEDQKIVTKSYDVSNLDVDNLMIIAVVFNDESTTKYSEPPDGNPFDAYYADAADGTLVVEGGHLPPEVGITYPKNGHLHILGKAITSYRLKTILIGPLKITAKASSDLGIEKVEFYIDDTLVAEFTEEPYEWTLKKVKLFRRFIIPQKHTISVIAYDSNGKTSTASIEVTTFLL